MKVTVFNFEAFKCEEPKLIFYHCLVNYVWNLAELLTLKNAYFNGKFEQFSNIHPPGSAEFPENGILYAKFCAM